MDACVQAESEADVKYKTKESAELEATISELETDKSASMDGLASVTGYLDKIVEFIIITTVNVTIVVIVLVT